MVGESLTTISLGRGVYAVETATASGKIGLVHGRRLALAVDAGVDASEGARLVDAVRASGFEPNRLVYTHGHNDHVLGSAAFREAITFAHVDAAAHLDEQLPAFADKAQLSVAELRTSLALPEVLFDETIEIDLDGVVAQVIPTPGHSPGSACVLVPSIGVLFGGDTVVTGILPYFRDGDSQAMEGSLRRLADESIDILIPGHGPIVRGATEVRSAITWSADYIGRIRDHVLPRLGLQDIEVIVAEAPFEAFIGERLPRSEHRMEWRHEQAIRNMIIELSRNDSSSAVSSTGS